MLKQLCSQSNSFYIALMLFSSTILGIESQVNNVYAQSSRSYLKSTCDRAYNQYRQYNNQPVVSPLNSSFSTSSHNMRMATQALNVVTDCAIKYSNLVQKNSSYCHDAINYTSRISPIMSTTAVTINYYCSR